VVGIVSEHYSAEWLPSVFNKAIFSFARRVFEKTFSRINAGESIAFSGRFISAP
jgi:hypothetical protein